jgi:hypothetical protein
MQKIFLILKKLFMQQQVALLQKKHMKMQDRQLRMSQYRFFMIAHIQYQS